MDVLLENKLGVEGHPKKLQSGGNWDRHISKCDHREVRSYLSSVHGKQLALGRFKRDTPLASPFIEPLKGHFARSWEVLSMTVD